MIVERHRLARALLCDAIAYNAQWVTSFQVLIYEAFLHKSDSFRFAMLQHVLNDTQGYSYSNIKCKTGNEFFVQLKCWQRAKIFFLSLTIKKGPFHTKMKRNGLCSVEFNSGHDL
jgi:hypothetical protein